MQHSKQAIIYACSASFEKASYYGTRAILVLFMVGEGLKLSKSEAIHIFGVLTVSITASKIIGGLLGDLLIGNRKTLIFGGLLQGFGCFILCFQSLTTFYIGLVAFILGSGFFSSNVLAQFAKKYTNTPNLLDAGFTSLHVAINLGAFIGVLVLGYIGESNFNYGFITAGILIILATAFIFFTKEDVDNEVSNYKSKGVNRRFLYVVSVIVIFGSFTVISGITYFGVYEVQERVFEGVNAIPKAYLNTLISTHIGLVILIIFAVVWTYVYTNSFFKIFIGLIIKALSFVILLFIPDTLNDLSLMVFVLSSLLFSVGDMLISPIIYSVITRLSNSKYLAVILSLVAIPAMFFDKISELITENTEEIGVDVIFKGSIVILAIFGIMAYVLFVSSKKTEGVFLSKEVKDFLS